MRDQGRETDETKKEKRCKGLETRVKRRETRDAMEDPRREPRVAVP
jgi:hypothetical protein